jgi:tight adherence protein C
MNLISSLLVVENIILLLVSLAAFATVITAVAPMMDGDRLQARIKSVNIEKDKLRLAQKAQLAGNNEPRLRDRQKKNVFSQIVATLNLRKIFQAEASRDKLRMAGYRNDNNLVTFLVMRMAMPILLSILAFFYFSFVFPDKSSTHKLAVAVIGLIVGYMLPGILLQSQITKRQQSIKRAWSDALDLLLICVEAGMALEPSLARVAKEVGSQSIPLAEELTLTVAELSYLQDRRKALDNLGKRCGLETVKSVVTSLVQAERYGTPLGSALRALAQENRDARMSEAERKAAALGPKLTVPMMLFFMPCIFVVLLTPSVIKVMATM